MDDLYRENILDHFQNPRNFGQIDSPDITFKDSNPLCGDELQIDIKVEDEKVTDVKFHCRCCAICKASASMLTELIEEQTVEDLKNITKEDIMDNLGITLGPVRLKCALLPLKVLKAGVYGIDKIPDEEED